jgi:hypothetical protein
MKETTEIKRYAAIATVVLFWLLTPVYLQMEHGYSAIKVSFGITVLYYIGFKLWKHRNPGHEQP